MIDLHCHLLPGIDDGPPELGATLELARAHLAAGVQTVACTPHVNWDAPNRSEAISAATESLRAELADAEIDLTIVAAAEVGLTMAVELDRDELTRLRLGGGEWLLLEAPLSVSVGVDTAVGVVAAQGHRILLAHPERCPAFQRDPDSLRRLVDQGVLCQVTATALTGQFGRTVQRFALELMREGLIHVVASDAHDARRRPPGLREHVVSAGFEHRADWLTQEVPAAILAGERIPPAPPGPEPKRRWWRR
jgi:protein-tyrosine phosphatase